MDEPQPGPKTTFLHEWIEGHWQMLACARDASRHFVGHQNVRPRTSRLGLGAVLGHSEMKNSSLGTWIKALAVRFQEPRIGQWPFMGMASSRVVVCGLAVILLGMSACGAQLGATTGASRSPTPCSQYRAFSLSLAKDTGGEVSPIAAAQWFATHGGVWTDIPTTGWSVIDSSESSTSVQSGSFTLDVWQGSDGTWQVASGKDAAC